MRRHRRGHDRQVRQARPVDDAVVKLSTSHGQGIFLCYVPRNGLCVYLTRPSHARSTTDSAALPHRGAPHLNHAEHQSWWREGYAGITGVGLPSLYECQPRLSIERCCLMDFSSSRNTSVSIGPSGLIPTWRWHRSARSGKRLARTHRAGRLPSQSVPRGPRFHSILREPHDPAPDGVIAWRGRPCLENGCYIPVVTPSFIGIESHGQRESPHSPEGRSPCAARESPDSPRGHSTPWKRGRSSPP